jgi:phosphotransferase system enzyme I (PtsP)
MDRRAHGLAHLKTSPSAVAPLKSMLLDLDAAKAAALIGPLIDQPEIGVSIRDRLVAFVEAEGLQL